MSGANVLFLNQKHAIAAAHKILQEMKSTTIHGMKMA
jgi:hypothetical protein